MALAKPDFTQRQILWFWLPLAASWGLMSAEVLDSFAPLHFYVGLLKSAAKIKKCLLAATNPTTILSAIQNNSDGRSS